MKEDRERERERHYLADLGVGGSGSVDSIVFSGVLGINDAFLVWYRDATQVQAPEIHGCVSRRTFSQIPISNQTKKEIDFRYGKKNDGIVEEFEWWLEFWKRERERILGCVSWKLKWNIWEALFCFGLFWFLKMKSSRYERGHTTQRYLRTKFLSCACCVHVSEWTRRDFRIFFENNNKSQTTLLVNTFLKLFGYLTTRDQKTRFWSNKSRTMNSISTSCCSWRGNLSTLT